MMETTQCPTCQGRGELTGYAEPGFRLVTVKCNDCKGTGEITPEHLQRIEQGRQMRRDRRARGESMTEAAKRLGMTIIQYNHLEHGRE